MDLRETTVRLSRRTLFLSSVGGGMGLVLLQPSVTLAATPIDGADIRVKRAVDHAWPNSDFSRLTTMNVPTLLDLRWLEAFGPTADVVLEADRRMFEWGTRASVQVPGGERSSSVLTVSQAGNIGRASGQVHLPGVADRTLEFALPIRKVGSFPVDNILDANPIRITIQSATGVVLVLVATPEIGSPITAWGVELFPIYGEWAVRDHDRSRATYRYPVGVQLRSVGPAAAPAGLLDVVVDSRVVSGMTLDSASMDDSPLETPWTANSMADGAFRLSVETPAIPAGSHYDVKLSASLVGGVKLKTVKYSTVSFVGDMGPTSYQRDTRRYSVVDLSSSGAPLFDDIAEGAA